MRPATIILFAFAFAGVLPAQSPPAVSTRPNVLDAATRLGNAGDATAARALIDSALNVTALDSLEYGALLFARATFAPSVLDAALDYERIIADYPSANRREESLLRMSQRAITAGDAEKALSYLKIMKRDYPRDSSQATAGYWIARVELDMHDVVAACEANRAALGHARKVAHALTGAIEAQAKQVCTSAMPISSAPIPSGPTETTPARLPTQAVTKQYAVQVSAFATRRDADAMTATLRRDGLDAHVDGTTRPFRVRVGRYDTFAEAVAELRELKKKKMSGFVAEMTQ